MFSASVPTCWDRFSCTCGWPCSWKICGAPGTSNEASLMYTFCSDSCAEASPAPLPVGLRGAFSVMEVLLRIGRDRNESIRKGSLGKDRGLSHDVPRAARLLLPASGMRHRCGVKSVTCYLPRTSGRSACCHEARPPPSQNTRLNPALTRRDAAWAEVVPVLQ